MVERILRIYIFAFVSYDSSRLRVAYMLNSGTCAASHHHHHHHPFIRH